MRLKKTTIPQAFVSAASIEGEQLRNALNITPRLFVQRSYGRGTAPAVQLGNIRVGEVFG